MRPRPLVLGHRGAPLAAEENTLEAFRIALAMGADGVELDVRRTRDGNLVVHHDATAPGVGVLADRSLGELRAARPEIPTLDESLSLLEGAMVNVEIKNFPQDPDFDASQRVVDDVVALLHARSGRDRVIVSSFNLGTVDRVRALDGTIGTGFLTLLGFDPLDACTVAADRGHAALHPDVRSLPGPIAPAVVERAAALGLAVNTWTVDAAEEVVRLAAAGVDAIITNRPDVARRALGR
ncbi:MAG: glycerophosphodiester phosphodiesterase [Acidimicrobiia bacterium]